MKLKLITPLLIILIALPSYASELPMSSTLNHLKNKSISDQDTQKLSKKEKFLAKRAERDELLEKRSKRDQYKPSSQYQEKKICKNIKLRNIDTHPLEEIEIAKINNTFSNFSRDRKVGSGDFCRLNLVGKMLYKAQYFKRDKAAAKQIFFYLANQGHPASQYNLALLAVESFKEKNTLSKSYMTEKKDIVYFLLGIYSRYLSDKKYEHISKKSLKLLNQFTESLELFEQQSVKQAISRDMIAYAIRTDAKKQAWIKKQDQIMSTVMPLLALGGAMYGISNTPNVESIPSGSTFDAGAPGGFFKSGFDWNPLGLQQIQ